MPNPIIPQTLTVQYDVTAIDGVTPSVPFSRGPGGPPAVITPNAEQIYVVDQTAVGLVDPDLGSGGSIGDRFIPWIEVAVDAMAMVEVALVDGEDTSRLLQVVSSGLATPTEPFYRDGVFRCPQGGLIRVRSIPEAAGTKLRLRIQSECEDCPPTSPNGNGSLAQDDLDLEFGVLDLAGTGANPRYLWPGSGRTIAQGRAVARPLPTDAILRSLVVEQNDPGVGATILTYQVTVNGALVAVLPVPITSTGAALNGLSVPAVQGDELAVRVLRDGDHPTLTQVFATTLWQRA